MNKEYQDGQEVMNSPAIVDNNSPPQANPKGFFALRSTPVRGISVETETLGKAHGTANVHRIHDHG